MVDAAVVFGFAAFQSKQFYADDAIVLGAAIYSPAIIHRSQHALELFKQKQVGELVLCGGRISNKDITEAAYMKNVVIKTAGGINPAIKIPTIILDDTSKNTYENIQHAKQKIGTEKSVVIVSDTYHLARGVLLAKRAGFKNIYWSAPDTLAYTPRHEVLFHFGREILAMLGYIPHFILG